MNRKFLILVLYTSLGLYACDYKTKENSLEDGDTSFLRDIPDIVSDNSYEGFELVNHCTQEVESAESEDPWEDSSSSGFGAYRPLPWHLPSTKENHYAPNKFYCSLKATAYKDDRCINHRRVNKVLFIHCYMQALENMTLDKQPLQELIERFKKHVIKEKVDTIHNKVMIYLTKKDISHRLLSYIPLTKNLWEEDQCLINGKFVRLKHSAYAPQEDSAETCNKKEKWISKYSGKELKARDYNFEDNQEHHEKIVKEFELLLQK